jgi:hypothetical protein
MKEEIDGEAGQADHARRHEAISRILEAAADRSNHESTWIWHFFLVRILPLAVIGRYGERRK